MTEADRKPPTRSNARSRRGLRLAFSLVVLLVCLAVAEFAVRPFVPRDIVGPSAVRHDSYYGKWLKPGYSGWVTANGLTYRLSVNSLGFRGPEPGSPPRGVVLFLGDSFTLGDTVDDGQEYPELVRGRLAEAGVGVGVVNAGLAGNGQGRWLKFLRRDAPGFAPRYVVMQLCNNDFRNNHIEGLFRAGEDGVLQELPVPDPSMYRRTQEVVESIPVLPYSYLYALTKQGVKRIFTNEEEQVRAELADALPDDMAETGPYDDLTFRLLDECLAICAEQGWPVVAVTAEIPEGSRLERIRAEFASRGAGVIVVPPKPKRPDLHNRGRDDHWNPAGHEHVADLVLEHIVDDPRFPE